MTDWSPEVKMRLSLLDALAEAWKAKDEQWERAKQAEAQVIYEQERNLNNVRAYSEELEQRTAALQRAEAKLAEEHRLGLTLWGALHHYGSHEGRCHLVLGGDRCTCGFAAALAASPEPEDESHG